jgi:uncharacterized repeat protein (TIGR01451 family)
VLDHLTLDRALEAEVELLKCLSGREARRLDARLAAARVAREHLGLKQRLGEALVAPVLSRARSANGTVLTNIATVNGDQPEPTPDPNPNHDATQTRVDNGGPLPPPPAPEPDPNGPVEPPVRPPMIEVLPERVAGTRLSLHKSATTAPAKPGATVACRLRVANVGEAGALRVTVCDTLPRGLTLVSAAGFSARARAICTSIHRLSVGAARALRVTARVTRNAPHVMQNLATARASNAPLVTARASIGAPAVQFTG